MPLPPPPPLRQHASDDTQVLMTCLSRCLLLPDNFDPVESRFA